jgi:LmbE family N-acetylglucosaminyl deacetylase
MLPVKLENREGGLRILFLGAHCDDIEIGCGGTIMRLSEEFEMAKLKWAVLTSTPERSDEARRSAEFFLGKFNNGCQKEVAVLSFRDGFLPFDAPDVKEYFEQLKAFNPDIVFTHYRDDHHQDHRFVSELTWNTFRDHLIFEYEIPKYDGDLGNPNFFVSLDSDVVNDKVNAILNYFPSQGTRQWFDRDTFSSLMRVRGVQSTSKTKYAEGFYLRKSVW